MTDIQLKQLKDNLWHSADLLRQGAHLAANKFGQPILGLVFLRYADILFKQHKDEILSEYESLKGGRREKTKALVRDTISAELDKDLPDSYDKESFNSKTNLLLNHFMDMSVQGYGWVA